MNSPFAYNSFSFSPVTTTTTTTGVIYSKHPELEHEILKENNYGRQLGRIEDVLELLIPLLSKEQQQLKEVKDFQLMMQQINQKKKDKFLENFNWSNRTELVDALEKLKKENPEEFKGIQTDLKKVIG
jgi:hypothetical protein